MEILSILALFLSIATITTFVLVFAVYILYLIREQSWNKKDIAKCDSKNDVTRHNKKVRSIDNHRKAYTGDLDLPQKTNNKPLFSKMETNESRLQTKFTPPVYMRESDIGNDKLDSDYKKETLAKKNRFLRYTKDGYVELSEDEKNENSLRWK